jgi:hypothetical protein
LRDNVLADVVIARTGAKLLGVLIAREHHRGGPVQVARVSPNERYVRLGALCSFRSALSSRLRPNLTRAGVCVPPHRHARLFKDTLLALAAETMDAVPLVPLSLYHWSDVIAGIRDGMLEKPERERCWYVLADPGARRGIGCPAKESDRPR